MVAVIALSGSNHWVGRIGLGLILFGPVLVSVLSAGLVSRHFNRG